MTPSHFIENCIENCIENFIENVMVLTKCVFDVSVWLTEYSVTVGSVTLRFYCTCLYISGRPRPSQPFTPYSFTLGNVVRELHRVLLSALSVEPQQSNCTLLLKALCLLLTNTSYHQLTNSYLSQVTEVLEKMATHRGEQ